ncbi:MAG: aminodeoxychorismate/anthranilate synthase component II [Albidovulum sp.]|nr:aminodeoxychorismate/anthranilate synthase component II [Albidovulum sp.]MDE0530949.1 aminodeoxychorismate/anthranilate synthase component II [Albidovulum sp.]
MLLLIDNYDSFTYNLVHYLGELGADIVVRRNDVLSAEEAIGLKPEAIVVSPGPGKPESAGICLQLVEEAAAARMPLLGVCLGHQAIGQAFGGKVVQCGEIVHGKTAPIFHRETGLFKGLPCPFEATRYHSLIVERKSLPETLEVTSWIDDGTVMGVRHRDLPIHGVQFHPESIASQYGHRILEAFLAESR